MGTGWLSAATVARRERSVTLTSMFGEAARRSRSLLQNTRGGEAETRRPQQRSAHGPRAWSACVAANEALTILTILAAKEGGSKVTCLRDVIHFQLMHQSSCRSPRSAAAPRLSAALEFGP
eukprot:scaffold45515_cov67-Phaeocystis_antarctica.AAC.5